MCCTMDSLTWCVRDDTVDLENTALVPHFILSIGREFLSTMLSSNLNKFSNGAVSSRRDTLLYNSKRYKAVRTRMALQKVSSIIPVGYMNVCPVLI
jgi:hypothetical protein